VPADTNWLDPSGVIPDRPQAVSGILLQFKTPDERKRLS
jgi:hypothetical protein